MPAAHQLALRIAFWLYLTGLLVWLGLGLVPTDMSYTDMLLLDYEASGLETVLAYAFSALNLALGLLLFLRRPNERVPQLLAFAMLGTAATFNLPSHVAFHITGSPWPIALVHFTFHIVSGVAYGWAVVLFPDGTLPRPVRLPRTWLRLVVGLSTVAVALVCWRGSFLDHPQFFIVFFGIGVAVLGVAAQTLRILDSHTTPRDRATARLLCAALLPALAAAAVWLVARAMVGFTDGAGQAAAVQMAVERLFPAVFAIVPAVLFAGVLRYRLWDIDRLLSQVLVYGLMGLALSTAYVLAVAAGGWLAGGGLWFTVVTLSAAAALVEPLRTAGRRWANRVVFGQVLSPSEAMRSLAAALERLTPSGELDHVVSVLVAATRTSSAQLWLVDGDRLVLAARAPGDRPAQRTEAFAGPDRAPGALMAAVGASCGWPIRHQGETLGLLCAETPAGRRLTARDDAVGSAVAAHAALVVHNASLTVTLARQVDALAAQAERLAESRQRLVAAQDAERRTLERALHDGAQQALVAAMIGARACAASVPVPREETEALREVLLTAQRDIDELSSDDRPAQLTRLGLRGGLQEAARLARLTGLAVEVDIDGPEADLQTLAPEVEAAVYFSCVEGLQNVTKYAAARTATVRVRCLADEVRFSVVDDGIGLADVGPPGGLGGLAQLAQRLAVLGGQISVANGSEGGAVLAGALPVRATNGVGR